MHSILAALAAFAATLCGVAAAHDFWLALDQWSAPTTDARVRAAFMAGHASDAKSWSLDPKREVALVTVGPDGRKDQRDALIYPTAGDKSGAALTLQGEGLHVIAFETDNALSQLGAAKFNAYLEQEGLSAAIAARRAAGNEEEPGRELYSRRAKALVRVGASDIGAPPPTVGHTLEIIPLDNIFALEAGEPLRIRVDYLGTPLEGALVSIESLDVGLLPEVRRTTDAAGLVAFQFPHRGAWKLDVVWSAPLTPGSNKSERADFETVFASLAFSLE